MNFMIIETTVLDFKLSNTFKEYESYMKASEQQAMFNEMGVKTFYLGKSLDDPNSMLNDSQLEHRIKLENISFKSSNC